jgi:S-adenosylmethionine decarboxylase
LPENIVILAPIFIRGERSEKNMRTLGTHIIIECSGCNPEILNDMEAVKKILTEAAIAARAEVRERAFHRFTPQGVSGVVVISESHLSIHTWPEYGYAALDIYTCGDSTMPWKACDYAASKFEAKHTKITEIKRGIPVREDLFSHEINPMEEKNARDHSQVAVVS